LVRKHLEFFKYYPSSARRRGIEGHVEIGFTLMHDGAADQVAVLHGSGYAVLDHAALETVYRAQPFPVAYGQYRFSLRFKRL
jgi:protein TonB